jgi:hypothetical protein
MMLGDDNIYSHELGCDVLLRAAQPELFRLNAFRVTGLPVDVSAQQITRHVDKLRMAEKFGGAAVRREGPVPLGVTPPLVKNCTLTIRSVSGSAGGG